MIPKSPSRLGLYTWPQDTRWYPFLDSSTPCHRNLWHILSILSLTQQDIINMDIKYVIIADRTTLSKTSWSPINKYFAFRPSSFLSNLSNSTFQALLVILYPNMFTSYHTLYNGSCKVPSTQAYQRTLVKINFVVWLYFETHQDTLDDTCLADMTLSKYESIICVLQISKSSVRTS